MKNQFLSMPIGQTCFFEINEALTEIKFTSAVIDLKTGVTTYTVQLPDGSTTEIESSIDNRASFYATTEMYLKKTKCSETANSLQHISRSLNIPFRLTQDDGDLASFSFYIWVIEDGFAREKTLPVDKVYLNKQGQFLTDVKLPAIYYTEQNSVEKLHKIKVVNADSSESYIGGELASILPNDSQKALVQEFNDICQRMRDANVRIISSESTMTMIAINDSEISSIYGYEDGYEDGYLSPESVPQLIIPYIPLSVCNDYDSDCVWFKLKSK